MTHLSNSGEDIRNGVLWISLMQCPNCGYATTVTNICRNCPQLPADEPMSEEYRIPCGYHLIQHFVTVDDMIVPAAHRSCRLEYTGLVENHEGERRLYKPSNNDELRSLEAGWGVVF